MSKMQKHAQVLLHPYSWECQVQNWKKYYIFKITNQVKFENKHSKVLLNSFPMTGHTLGVLSLESKIRKFWIIQGLIWE